MWPDAVIPGKGKVRELDSGRACDEAPPPRRRGSDRLRQDQPRRPPRAAPRRHHILEDPQANPFLPLFYRDMRRYALPRSSSSSSSACSSSRAAPARPLRQARGADFASPRTPLRALDARRRRVPALRAHLRAREAAGAGADLVIYCRLDRHAPARVRNAATRSSATSTRNTCAACPTPTRATSTPIPTARSLSSTAIASTSSTTPSTSTCWWSGSSRCAEGASSSTARDIIRSP